MSQAISIVRAGAGAGTTLRGHAVRGVGCVAAGRLGQQASMFITSVILARLLVPEDFGLLAIATAFGGFAAILIDAGLGDALIQRDPLREEHLNAAFLISVLIGLSAWMSFSVAAPVLAGFYAAPILVPVCRSLALGFVIGALATVPRALLRRRMEFRTLARIDVVATMAGGVVAVALAGAGAGIWSLVASSLAGTTAGSLLSWSRCEWRPRAALNGQATGDLVGFGGGLVGFNAVNYWARNVDNLLVGWLLGAAALGVYARAYFLMLLPIYQVTGVIATVMLPALASIRADPALVKSAFLRSLGAIGLVTAPAVIGLFVVADTLIPMLYGENWRGVVPVLRVLCLASLLQAFCNPVGWIYASRGRTDLMFRWGLFASGVQVLAIGLGGCLGTLSSIAGAYAVACVVIFYPCMAIPGRLIGATVLEMVSSFAGAVICSIAMGLLVFLVGRWLIDRPPSVILGGQVAVGVLAYWAMVHAFRLGAYRDLVGILFTREGFA